MSQRARNWLFLFVVIASVLIVDQATKRLVLGSLAVGETRLLIPALSPYFQITLSHNTGFAFGLLPQAGDFILIFALVVALSMLYFYPRIPAQAALTRLACGILMGGALGNAIDRLDHGFVIDFIHYQLPGVISNVSNLADHALVSGVALILIETWMVERKQKQDSPATG